MTAPVIMPQVTKTGEVATVAITTKTSKSHRATENVRMVLPRRTMHVALPDGTTKKLPRTQDGAAPIIATIQFSLN